MAMSRDTARGTRSMRPASNIRYLLEGRLTPFQKKLLAALAAESELSAERVLDMLLLDARLLRCTESQRDDFSPGQGSQSKGLGPP